MENVLENNEIGDGLVSGETAAASVVAVPAEPAAVPASDAPVSGTREKVAEGGARRARLGSMRELAEWDRGRIGYRFVKRAFDIAFSACVIAVAIVPSAVLCAAIAIESPGCPLYRQRRVGRIGADGRPREFTMWKFRSMVKGADRMKDALLAENEVEGPMFKMKDDPRVTRSAASSAGTPSTSSPSSSTSFWATCPWWARARRCRARSRSTTSGPCSAWP